MTRTAQELMADLSELCACEELRPGGVIVLEPHQVAAVGEPAPPCIYCESRMVVGQLLQEGLNLASSFKTARGHLEVATNERDRALADMAAAQQARTAVQHRYNVLKSQYDRMIEAVDLIKASMQKSASG